MYVESKSFEITKNAFEMRIIERGRKHFSNVSMGFAAAQWLRDALLEVAKLSNDQNLFRSFREGNKVYVVQKQKNDRGSFVSVTVLGDSKSRDCVIIPEGRDTWGWRGISHEIDQLLRPKVVAQQGANSRRPEEGNSTAKGHFRKEFQTFKEAVTLGGNIPKVSHIDTGVNIDLNQVGNGLIKGATEISLKLILGIDRNNKWEVRWAGVIDESSGDQYQAQQAINPVPINPLTRNITNPPLVEVPLRPKAYWPNEHGPYPHKVWRPRVTDIRNVQKIPEAPSGSTVTRPEVEHVSVHSCDIDSEISTHIVPVEPCAQPIADVMQGIGVVDRSWGSSSDWFLDLRDGRRLRIPVDLSAPMAKTPQEEAIAQKLLQWISEKREETNSGDGEDDSEWDLGSFLGGSDLIGMDEVLSPTRTQNDLALVDFVGGESSTPTELEPIAITVRGQDGSGGESPRCESLTLINGGLVGTNGGVVEGSEASEPVTMELLAIVLPKGVEGSGSEVGQSIGREPSDWVMRKEKGVGKVLGTSYEGYEQAVIELLMDIEARHIERKAAMIGI